MPDRLKVLFITAWYPSTSNPMQGIFIREHALSVHQYDDVMVIHLSGVSHECQQWQMSEEVNLQLSKGIPTYRFTTRKFPFPGVTFIIYLLGIWRALTRIRNKGFHPDILHANIYSAGVPAVILGKIYHIPTVISEHNSAFPRGLLSNINIRQARFAFPNAQCVTLCSNALKTSIEQYHFRGKYKVIPNAVDLDNFFYEPSQTPNNPPKCLFVGSLVPIKGLNIMLNALATIKDIPWTMDIIGDGPERSNYEELSKSFNIQGRVVFHGYQSHELVAQYMRQADLFISSSLWENFPSVLLEAQACGLPIVATDVGGIPEIVYPGSGWLAKPGDIESLAATLLLSLSQLAGINRLEIASKAKRYSRAEVGLLFHNLYKEILAR